jgi:hypothetical protein
MRNVRTAYVDRPVEWSDALGVNTVAVYLGWQALLVSESLTRVFAAATTGTTPSLEDLRADFHRSMQGHAHEGRHTAVLIMSSNGQVNQPCPRVPLREDQVRVDAGAGATPVTTQFWNVIPTSNGPVADGVPATRRGTPTTLC